MAQRGFVQLVGAGPGDPELLTLKAYKVIQQADVVLYDRLVSDAVMALIPEGCERVYVGKRRADHSVPQKQIGQLLVDYARQGKQTVRLKGGDPFIFGRGGEELEELVAAGIGFSVVPGITAASGCAAYAGIPLTHRDYSQSVRFITGHLKDDSVNLHWAEFAHSDQTLVFYMGLVGLPKIASRLQKAGRSFDTPLAIIERGTTPEQKVTITTLAEVAKVLATQEIHAPTLIIIGDVVNLYSKLNPNL
ncbi:uroporphyrinogen-III C-methyltransferase [Halioxenophilus aromaticivorans]|uniref:uroporphyrinogen-III C-methyltransferase n=1 Tax=Halioxenophilus aromaticivorans TaxID=1306992 RepID=A0AAV3UAE0_9ALTE